MIDLIDWMHVIFMEVDSGLPPLVFYYVSVCLPFLSLREIRLRLQDLTEMDCVSAGVKLRDDIRVAKSYNIVG
jgi:hypothetical protein